MTEVDPNTTVALRNNSIRVIAISDLHLGGNPPMMSRPQLLADFINGLPHSLQEDETLELVINGDFIDFLAIEPYAAITSDPHEALAKLQTVIGYSSPFCCVFDALAQHVAGNHRLVILVGNHDVELALPAVQEELGKRIAGQRGILHFIDDGRAYRVGNALIEHGNAYDGANANDWTGLRHLASAQSRGREEEQSVKASAGSRIVYNIVNKLKGRYPFLPTLQPEGDLLLVLMLAFEPELRYDIKKMAQLFQGKKKADGLPKKGVHAISVSVDATAQDVEIEAMFADDLKLLRSNGQQGMSTIGAWFDSWQDSQEDSLSYRLQNNLPISKVRLDKLRLAMSRIVDADNSELWYGETQQYGEQAERMLSTIPSLEVVVMGHTHLPRRRQFTQGIYINSGTWIDRFRIPNDVVNDASGEAIVAFLKRLLMPTGNIPLAPTYADLSIESDGRVRIARLLKYDGACK
jgi:UDP-2,3-diacylglucosamine pyrophosphatase LpxH